MHIVHDHDSIGVCRYIEGDAVSSNPFEVPRLVRGSRVIVDYDEVLIAAYERKVRLEVFFASLYSRQRGIQCPICSNKQNCALCYCA